MVTNDFLKSLTPEARIQYLTPSGPGKTVVGTADGVQEVDLVASARPAPGLRWGFLGDSITDGSGAGNLAYAYISEALAMAGGLVARPDSFEAGVPGQRSDQMLARLDTLFATGVQALVVLAGTNDASQGVSLDTYAANMAAIITRAKQRGLPVVVVTVPPRRAADAASIHRAIHAYNVWVRLIAPTYGCEVADAYTALADASGVLPAAHDSGDGIHPSALGHYKIAAEVARAMKRAASKPNGIITTAGGANSIPDALNARATVTATGWFENGGGTGTAPTYSFVADTSGFLPAGRWAQMDFNGTTSGGTRRLAISALPVTAGERWLLCGHFQVEVVAGDWEGLVTAGTAEWFPQPVNASTGVGVTSLPFYRCPGIKDATVPNTYNLGPVVYPFTIPSGMTSMTVWFNAKVPTGMHIKARLGAVGLINLTANGMTTLFDWGSGVVSNP